MVRPAGKLTGRIRTAAADVRDADLVRFIAARWGHGGVEGIVEDDDETDVTLDPGDGAGAAVTETADPDSNSAANGGAEPSEGVEEAVAKGEADVESGERGDDALPGTLRIFDVVIHSIEVMESIITAYRMAANRPDVMIEVPSDSCTAFDFHRAEEMIALGRKLTADALDRAGI